MRRPPRKEEEFRQTFMDAAQEQHRGNPRVFFILGEEGQCHESLVESDATA